MNRTRFLVLAGMILGAALLRLAPHPLNFTPIGAMALFGGACFADRRVALLLPLTALFVSDLMIAMHILVPVVYASFALNVLLGRWLLRKRRRRIGSVTLVTLAGSVQFFIVTNFACWLLFYPNTPAGLVTCYVAALPYFQNTLAGDLTYAAVLFGGLALVEARYPALREQPTAQPA